MLGHSRIQMVLRYAHPTEEHFLPLFVAWGAAGDDAIAERIFEGLEAGTLSMDSYAFRDADAVR